MASVEVEASPVQVQEKAPEGVTRIPEVSSEEKVAAPEPVAEVEAPTEEAVAPEAEAPAEVDTKEVVEAVEPLKEDAVVAEEVKKLEDAEETPQVTEVVEAPALAEEPAAKEAEPPKTREEANKKVPIEKTEE